MRLLLALIVAASLGMIGYVAVSTPDLYSQPTRKPAEEILTIVGPPFGRVLYVVVERDGAYFGEQRIDLKYAADAANAIVRKEKVRNVVIYGTDDARFGDVVQFYAGIDARRLYARNIAVWPEPTGTRKPLTGFYVPKCCYSIDVENNRTDHTD